MDDNIVLYVHRNKVKYMCKILKKIHGKTPEELLSKYGVYDTLPIDLEKLALNIGISLIPYNFTSMEQMLNKKGILGLILTEGDNAAIYYRMTDTLNRVRFTIAHEIAHCCALDPNTKEPHVEWRMDDDTKSDFEKEMDIFAGRLLMPLEKLKQVYMSLDRPTSTVLAQKFGVSVPVMEARLNYLGISHYNSKDEPVFYGNE